MTFCNVFASHSKGLVAEMLPAAVRCSQPHALDALEERTVTDERRHARAAQYRPTSKCRPFIMVPIGTMTKTS